MDKSGSWSLSPAFDVIYAFQPSGTWTSSHQMTLNGKRDGFRVEDFKACARAASMKREVVWNGNHNFGKFRTINPEEQALTICEKGRS